MASCIASGKVGWQGAQQVVGTRRGTRGQQEPRTTEVRQHREFMQEPCLFKQASISVGGDVADARWGCPAAPSSVLLHVCDTTFVCPVTAAGLPRKRAKKRTYPELCRSNRCRLTVIVRRLLARRPPSRAAAILAFTLRWFALRDIFADSPSQPRSPAVWRECALRAPLFAVECCLGFGLLHRDRAAMDVGKKLPAKEKDSALAYANMAGC